MNQEFIMLEKLLSVFTNAQNKKDEKYLGEAVDIYELERRMNNLDDQKIKYSLFQPHYK